MVYVLPKKLRREPLIEVIWKIQFRAKEELSSVMHGILYSELKRVYSKITINRLPFADIPDSVAQLDPNLQLVPRYMILANEQPILWQVGYGIITLNNRKPYIGWINFRKEIEKLCTIIKDNNMLEFPLVCSFRYINLLESEFKPRLSNVGIKLQIEEHIIEDRVQLRAEIPRDEVKLVVQCASPAKAQVEGKFTTGLIFDIEAISEELNNWEELNSSLDCLHDFAKELFIKLLSEDLLRQFNPEY